MRIYVLTKVDGSVSIMHVLGDKVPELQVAKMGFPEGEQVVEIEEISDSDIPKSRKYRDAWTKPKGKPIECDMGKCRDIFIHEVRRARGQKFNDLGVPHRLDDDLEKAVLSPEKRRQLKKLRDLPQGMSASVDSAKTPEELDSLWPEELG